MASLQLPRKPNGDLILPGRVIREYVEPFLFTNQLPSWLTLTGTGATVAVNSTATTSGGLTLTAANNQFANLKTTTPINLASFDSILFAVEGLSMGTNGSDGSTWNWAFGISGSGTGAYITDNPSGQVQTKVSGGTPTTIPATYQVAAETGSGQYLRNIGILLLPQLKHFYILEDDQIMFDADFTGVLPMGQVQPNINIASTTAGTKTLSFKQIRLRVTSN